MTHPSKTPEEPAPTPGEATLRMGDDRSGVTSLEARTSMSALTVGEIIGEGGMGVVRSAIQNSLARHVAIKTAHPGSDEQVSQRVLSEAWVTGYLEHPGVVPVYDIVRASDGSPVVVMRRIHGATWEERIRDNAWAASAGARDLLEQNLRTIVRLCDIVEFAHEKGVVHRDIKPENVMLGSFGEVYLLDWGLAVALNEEAGQHLLRAADAKDMAGTLHYAAPEMIGLVDARVSSATDVYLLGAVLYEVATGRAPHDHPTAPRTFESIAASPPTDWAGIAPRLAAIGQRAMQKLPTNRHSTVSALRREILDYLRSRDSEHLALGATRALTHLGDECKKAGARRKVYDLYGECRFAFREALRMWPANEEAEAGLARASTLVVEYELGRDPRVAHALLEEAQGIAPELARRVRRAAAAEAEERAGLSRLAQDHDPVVGRRARRIFGAVGLMVVAQCGLFAGAGALGVSLVATRTLQIGLWWVITGSMTLLLERKLWPMTVGLAVAFVVVLAWPESRSIVSAVAALVVTLNVAVIWSRSAA